MDNVLNKNYPGSNLEILLSLLMGELPMLLEYLSKKDIPDQEIIPKIDVALKIINLDSKGFKQVTDNQDELKKYKDLLSTHFISPIILYVEKDLKEKVSDKVSIARKGIEKIILEKAIKLLKSPGIFTQAVMLMHYIMFGVAKKCLITESVESLYDAIMKALPTELEKYLPLTVSTLTGFSKDKKEKSSTFHNRRTNFLELFINMSIPELVPKLDLIKKLVKLSLHLVKLGNNTEKIQSEATRIAEELAMLTGINVELIRGVFGIMKGEIPALINFVAPVCQIDEGVVIALQNVLQGSNKLLANIENENRKIINVIDDVERSSWLSILKKVNDGEAGIRELFYLVDQEGDKSGGISVEEFAGLMQKLNIPMTTHRINEVFARCKSRNSNKPANELDTQGKNTSYHK